MSQLNPKGVLALQAEHGGLVVRCFGNNVRISAIKPRAVVFVGRVSNPLRLCRFCWDNNIQCEQHVA